MRVFLFSSLASLRVFFFFFGLVFFWEMSLLMMIWWLNSVLVAFYYGNNTYPSHDPPKMGFLSTVPQDAASQLVSAVAAVKTGDNFPCRFLLAPSLFPLLLPTPSLQLYQKWRQAEPSTPPERRLTAYLWPQLRAVRRRRALRRDRIAVRSEQGGWVLGWGWRSFLGLLGCCNCGRDDHCHR